MYSFDYIALHNFGKPIAITSTFIEILTICILTSTFRIYVIPPILITLAYFYSFIKTVSNINFGLIY